MPWKLCQASWFLGTKCSRFALFIQVSHLHTILDLPEPANLTPLFGLSLLLTTLEALHHSCICSSVLFNGDLGLSSSSSKSVTSFPLSSMLCYVMLCFIFLFSVSTCSFPAIYTSSDSNLALIWSAWANIGCPFFLVQPCPVLLVEWTLLSLALPPYFFYTKLSPLWQMTWILGFNSSAH